MPTLYQTSLLCACLALSGCVSIGSKSPPAEPPLTLPSPQSLVAQPQLDVPSQVQQPPQEVSFQYLIQLINDPQLSSLVADTLANNLDLRLTALRLQQQQLQSGLTRSAYQPNVNLSGSADRNSQLINSTGLNINMSWEVDVWQRLAQQQDQASANTHVAKLDLLAAQNSLTSRVIQQWLDMVYRHHLLQVEQQWLHSLQATEASIKERFLQGDGSLTDLEAAKSSTAQVRASYIARQQRQKDAWRQLALLQGRSQNPHLTLPEQLPEVSAPARNITADVLILRPDVAIAYQNIVIANAGKALAQKALLPSFSLSASVSNSGTNLDDLLSGSIAWNLLGNLTQPLFDGGRLRTDVEISELQLEQAYLSFQSTYLNGLHEAVGMLENEHSLAQQERQMTLAWQHAEASLKHYRSGYVEGLNDILSLLNAQQSAYSARMQMLQTQQSRLVNRINLGLALGMGI